MTTTATDPYALLETVWRMESARIVAGVARVVRDVGLAEELAHDALVAAMEQWPRDGVPDNPGAWLAATARRRAIDVIRREQNLARKTELLDEPGVAPAADAAVGDGATAVGDDVLALLFATCHPAVARESRVALTLRLFGGLTTDEIAHAFLVPSPTIGQRISRAKKRLAGVGPDALAVPVGDELAARLGAVLEVIYLVFNEGYAATTGVDWTRPSLCVEAMRLGRVLAALAPEEPEVHGLVALMELQASRLRARVGPSGEPVLLGDQDRARWDRVLLGRGLAAPGPRRGGRAARALRAAGGDRRVPCPRPVHRRHRLGGDRGPLRRARGAHPVPGDRAQPGRGRRPRRGPGGRARRARAPEQRADARRLPPAAGRARRHAHDAGPRRRGRRRDRAGPRSRPHRRRTGAAGAPEGGSARVLTAWLRSRAVTIDLLPAVDVVDGQAVRLVQGVAGTETGYGDPLDAARAWAADGAEWLHLVDLDAAFGRGSNAELLASVVEKIDIKVELSGGIRDDASLRRALDTGCRRVNIGTAALEDPAWCAAAIAEFGDRVAVGLDVKISEGRHRLAARGWVSDGGDLWSVLARLDAEGCARYVVTDVGRDGTLTGPNTELLEAVCARTDRPVVASGGVSSLDDLRTLNALADQGVEGAIVGKALYAGNFTLAEALATTRT